MLINYKIQKMFSVFLHKMYFLDERISKRWKDFLFPDSFGCSIRACVLRLCVNSFLTSEITALFEPHGVLLSQRESALNTDGLVCMV